RASVVGREVGRPRRRPDRHRALHRHGGGQVRTHGGVQAVQHRHLAVDDRRIAPSMRAAKVLLRATLLAVACSGPAAAPINPKAQIPNPKSQPKSETSNPESRTPNPGSEPITLRIPYDKNRKPTVGSSVEATAKGLPPNKTLDIVWGTVDGGWVVEDYYH